MLDSRICACYLPSGCLSGMIRARRQRGRWRRSRTTLGSATTSLSLSASQSLTSTSRGAVSPWERPGLGPWLTDDRLSMWDALCVAKLDRLTRSLIDFVTLMSWLEARGKTLVCLDPQLDLTTPSGRAFAQILVTFAEYERETIAARVRDAWHKLRTDGQYAGGQVPFGYRPVKLARGWGGRARSGVRADRRADVRALRALREPGLDSPLAERVWRADALERDQEA